MKRLASLLAVLALLVMTVGAVNAQFEPAEPQEGCEFHEDTRHNLCEPFLSYWNNNGGLPVFGWAISEAFDESNPDLGVDLLTQYFERERLEYHPENEGTEYEILLGRLGAQILELKGVNWFAFPKADPSAEHYVPETGHAIAPEFWEYWSSHGLDLGDEGISYRESVALFGYPISPLQTETNMAGDTVPTQWFERARFELHEDGTVLLGLLGNELLALTQPPPFPEPPGEVVADGLNNPRGLDVDSEGNLYIAEAGVGGDACVTIPGEDEEEDTELCFGTTGAVASVIDGVQAQAGSGLPSILSNGEEAVGPQDVVAGEGEIYAIVGLGADPAARADMPVEGYGYVWSIGSDGSAEMVLDVAVYEGEANPDGGAIDTNPYSLVMDGAGGWVISDAGMNALLHVDAEGTISTLAVFEDRLVDTSNIPIPGLPPEIPMQAVPTGVTAGPDGAYYVGELTGFPFVPGAARVWRVTPEGEAEVYAEGFTNVIDVAFDGAGNLYVLEMLTGGLLTANPEDFETLAGRLTRVLPDGSQEVVVDEGLIMPTGLDIGPDGTIYVANFGVMPGLGQVVAIEGEEPPPPPEGPVVLASGLASPRGIAIDGDTIYVAEVGSGGDGPCIPGPTGADVCAGQTGAVTAVNGGPTQVVTGLPSIAGEGGVEAGGPHDVILNDDGSMYVLTGLGADPTARADLGDDGPLYGSILLVGTDGSVTRVIDASGYEGAANPDGGEFDSNPFRFVSDGEGGFVVTDAGANALVHFASGGEITTLAFFEDRMVDAPPFLELPEGTQIPMQSVPTGLAIGPDGAYYVGELTGFPFVPGAARVWRVTPEGEAEVYAEGFTNIVDVAFDGAGNLYVLEIAAGGLLGVDPADPSTMQGRLVMVAPDKTQTVVATEGLIVPTGLAIGDDGSIFVSNNGIVAGLGELLLLNPGD